MKDLGKDVPAVLSQTKALVEKCPRVSGRAREQGKIYISQDMDRAISGAAGIALSMWGVALVHL